MTDRPADAPHSTLDRRGRARRRRRYAADRRLRVYGIAAITLALGLLGILLATLVIGGYPAFTQTHVRVDFPISRRATSTRPTRPTATAATVVQEGVARAAARRARAAPSCARLGEILTDEHPVHRPRRRGAPTRG